MNPEEIASHLIGLGGGILTANLDRVWSASPDAITKIEEYGDFFDQAVREGGGSLEVFLAEISEKKRAEIVRIHNQVLKVAQSLKSQSLDELRALKVKGKAIKVYINEQHSAVDLGVSGRGPSRRKG